MDIRLNLPIETHVTPKMIGIALDGFRIYAPALSNITLDSCNGHNDQHGYRYYLQATPPFFPPCLRGVLGSFHSGGRGTAKCSRLRDEVAGKLSLVPDELGTDLIVSGTGCPTQVALTSRGKFLPEWLVVMKDAWLSSFHRSRAAARRASSCCGTCNSTTSCGKCKSTSSCCGTCAAKSSCSAPSACKSACKTSCGTCKSAGSCYSTCAAKSSCHGSCKGGCNGDEDNWYNDMSPEMRLLCVLLFTAVPAAFGAWVIKIRSESPLIILLVVLTWLFLILPIPVLMVAMDLSALESVYWAMQTVTTVGFGDILMTKDWLKLCTTLYSSLGMLAFFTWRQILLDESHVVDLQVRHILQVGLALLVFVFANTWYWSYRFATAPGSPAVNGFYFTISVISTIGFGDLLPQGPEDCIVFCVTAGLGIPTWFFFIGKCAAYVSDKIWWGRSHRLSKILIQRLEGTDETNGDIGNIGVTSEGFCASQEMRKSCGELREMSFGMRSSIDPEMATGGDKEQPAVTAPVCADDVQKMTPPGSVSEPSLETCGWKLAASIDSESLAFAEKLAFEKVSSQ